MIDDLNSSPLRGLLRPVLVLTGWVLAVALVLLPIAWGRPGPNGPLGLAAAAAICLVAGWTAEGIACALRGIVQPLGLMLLGMGIRMLPPLSICLVLAVRRANGREYLAFIAYLLTFYLVTLALETRSAVKRIPRGPSRLNHNGAH